MIAWLHASQAADELRTSSCTSGNPEPLTPDSDEFYGQMVALRLPAGAPEDLQQRLYDEYRVEIPVSEHGGRHLIRASFQGYNDEGDLDRLREALAALLAR